MARGLRRSLLASVGACVLSGTVALQSGPDRAFAGEKAAPAPRIDPTRCWHTIRTAKDPVKRYEAVRLLGRVPGERGVEILARVVRGDADLGLRLEAAQTIGVVGGSAAVEAAIDLAADGGPRELRNSLARVLVRLEVPPARIAAEVDSPLRNGPSRVHLTETLAWNRDALAAAHLERLARLRRTPVGEAAIRALERHPLGPRILPDLLLDVLSDAEDADSLVTALDSAERHGDRRLEDLAPRLLLLDQPVVTAAVDVALAHVAERRSAPGARAPAARARVRDRVDRVHVFHLGRDTSKVWAQVRNDLLDSRPRWEDVRVACVGYLEATPSRPSCAVTEMPFTRDPAKVDEYFLSAIVQFSRGNGQGMSAAIEHAYARSGWRWESDRSVHLHADASPRDLSRAVVPPALHLAADGTKLRVSFFGMRRSDIPAGVERIAASGRTVTQLVEPANRVKGGGTPFGDKR